MQVAFYDMHHLVTAGHMQEFVKTAEL